MRQMTGSFGIWTLNPRALRQAWATSPVSRPASRRSISTKPFQRLSLEVHPLWFVTGSSKLQWLTVTDCSQIIRSSSIDKRWGDWHKTTPSQHGQIYVKGRSSIPNSHATSDSYACGGTNDHSWTSAKMAALAR